MANNFFKVGKLSGKGATAVICFCLAAVAAIGVYSYRKSAEELNTELLGSQESAAENIAESEAEIAGAAADNIPMEDAYPAAEDILLDSDGLSGDSAADADVSLEGDSAAESVDSDELTDAIVSPLSGEIIFDYSDGELVKSPTLGVWKTHDGIDIAGSVGDSVRSMTSGTVISVTEDALMGVTVVIDHGSGYQSYYCNLASDVDVSEGEAVSAGTVIGEIGSSAESEISEDPHLHFAVKENGEWTDPTELLSSVGS
ncbi:MAG: M23 family metallopeptidase [Oscillospiraceae bacterium]|nr:M23 family metallopeptidase [Oscillospiraceae bacterium]